MGDAGLPEYGAVIVGGYSSLFGRGGGIILIISGIIHFHPLYDRCHLHNTRNGAISAGIYNLNTKFLNVPSIFLPAIGSMGS